MGVAAWPTPQMLPASVARCGLTGPAATAIGSFPATAAVQCADGPARPGNSWRDVDCCVVSANVGANVTHAISSFEAGVPADAASASADEPGASADAASAL